jgi:hypothetical protein
MLLLVTSAITIVLCQATRRSNLTLLCIRNGCSFSLALSLSSTLRYEGRIGCCFGTCCRCPLLYVVVSMRHLST